MPDKEFLGRQDFLSSDNHFDFSVCVGTFNLVYQTEREQQDFVFEELSRLFARTRRALFANFMHDQVDFKQENAWHQPVGAIFNFASSELSRYVEVDASYLPYEYTLIVHRGTPNIEAPYGA